MDERNLVSDVFLTPNTSSRRRNMSTGTTIKAVWCNLHAASFKQSIEPIARQVLLIGDDFGLEGGVLGGAVFRTYAGKFRYSPCLDGSSWLDYRRCHPSSTAPTIPLAIFSSRRRSRSRKSHSQGADRAMSDTSRLLLPEHFPAPSVGLCQPPQAAIAMWQLPDIGLR
jgi:hypothetical protein